MEEEFEFDFSNDAQNSIERYEEMIRNQDQYFFDAQAFEYIIDNIQSWSSHKSCNQCHDNHHRKNFWRKHTKFVTNIQYD